MKKQVNQLHHQLNYFKKICTRKVLFLEQRLELLENDLKILSHQIFSLFLALIALFVLFMIYVVLNLTEVI